MSDRLRFLKRDLTSASNLGKLDADGWGGETVALVGLANTRWVFFNTGRSEMQLKKQRPLSQKYAHLGRSGWGGHGGCSLGGPRAVSLPSPGTGVRAPLVRSLARVSRLRLDQDPMTQGPDICDAHNLGACRGCCTPP